MKLTFVFLTAFLLNVSAKSSAQKVTLNVKNVTLDKVFREIERQTGYGFLFTKKMLKDAVRVTLDVKNEPVNDVLYQCFVEQPLNYTIENNTIVISRKPEVILAFTSVPKPVTDINGIVKDEKGNPLAGVTVFLKRTNKGTSTDVDGRFTIDANPGDVLVFTIVGYQKKSVTVAQSSNLSVVMEIEEILGKEIVVTALGIKRETRSLGYSVQKVEGSTLTDVKGVDVATSLTGKVAGLNVLNSTEFDVTPSILLRGANALLVVDGVPYTNISLSDIAADDIESVDVLKGATASALYGARGGNGAIMVTTKKGNGKKSGLDVSFNSSNMFSSGFLAFPKVQTSYSSGGGGKYGTGDYVWGDKLDIGRTANQYDPFTYQSQELPLVSKGKKNLQNFLQQGFILNNNLSISQKGKNGSLRASYTDVFNRGQYPNTKLNKITASIAGDIKVGNFSLEGGFTYNKRFYPNNVGTGYGGGGYMYNLVVWSGTEYDIRDFRNYWVPGKENIKQSWSDNSWYDNPYFIAHEILHGSDYNITNGFVNASFKIKPWLKAVLRSGIDEYSQTDEQRNAISAVGGWNKKGYYSITKSSGFSTNNDLMLTANAKAGDFKFDGLIGGSLYYFEGNSLNSATSNGITIPGFYSLNASVDPSTTSPSGNQKQVNGLYSKVSMSYKNFAFVDVTGRNDWSSTLASENRSYFYPSVSGSLVYSELLKLPEWVGMAKLRGSWTQTKLDPSIYAINNSYNISTNVWNGASASSFPTSIRSAGLLPQTNRTYEIGAAFSFLNNKVNFDATYFNNLYYDRIVNATVSGASGFSSVLVNTQEQLGRRGVELSANGSLLSNRDFSWNIGLNWSTNRQFYAKLDTVYSSQLQWVTKGSRWDWIGDNKWELSPDGQPIMQNGFPVKSPKESIMGYSDPDWIWGFSNTIRYKNITLAFSFDGRVGGTAYNNTIQALWNSGAAKESDNEWRYDEVVNGNKSYIADGVTVVSGTATRDVYGNIISDTRKFEKNTTKVSYESYTKTYQDNAYTPSPQNYVSQTFFKLREIALSYNIPAKYLKKLAMKNASIGFVGQNMLLWAKQFKDSDPDVGFDNLNSPSIRYMGFNLKVNF